MQKHFLTINEVAELLGISTKTLRRWEAKGLIVPHRTVGNQRRYSFDDVDKLKLRKLHARTSASLVPTTASFEAKSENQKTIQDSSLDKMQDLIPAEASGKTDDYSPTTGHDFNFYPKFAVRYIKIIGFSSLFVFSLLILASLGLGGFSQQNLKSSKEKMVKLIHETQGSLLKLAGSNSSTDETMKKLGMTMISGEQVLQAATAQPDFAIKINVPAEFASTASVAGNLTAPNILYGITAGQNITISGDLQNPTISATSSGINSFQGQTGDINLTAGTGISISGLTISNSDTGSSVKTFKNIKVDSTTISAGSNTDTLELVAGSGVTLSADTSSKKVTIAGTASTVTGWTDDGTVVRLTTSTDSVGIGTTSPDTTLHVAGTFKVTGATTFNGLAYTWPSSQTSNYVLETDGSGNLSWIEPTNVGKWNTISGVITPKIETQDLLIGGQASSSAKFAVLNVAGGTPTASVSAGTAGGAYLTATGNLATTAYQTLALGGGDTGNISITTKGGFGGAGRLEINGIASATSASLTCVSVEDGIVTAAGACGAGAGGSVWTQSEALGVLYPQNPTVDLLIGGISSASAEFHVYGAAEFQGTYPVASIAANTSFAGLVVDNKASGDLFTASSSGRNRFVITQNGNVGINNTLPSAYLDITQTAVNTPGFILTTATSTGIGDARSFQISDDSTNRVKYTALFNTFSVKGGIKALWDSAAVNIATDDSAATALRVGGASGSQTGNVFEAYSYADSNVDNFSDLKFAINPSGTISTASISANTSFAGLVADNKIGDLFTASSSGLTRFTIKQSGDVEMGSNNFLYFDDSGHTARIRFNSSTSTIGIANTNGSGSIQTASTNFYVKDAGVSTLLYGDGTNLRVGIGKDNTGTLLGTLDVRPSSGTLPVATVSGSTSFASLIVDNTQNDLFTASSSGVTQFVIRNGGNVGIGNVPRPTAMLDVAGTASISSTLKFRTGAGAIQTTANNTLTLGGDTTGNIILSPTNGSGRVGLGTTTPVGAFHISNTLDANTAGTSNLSLFLQNTGSSTDTGPGIGFVTSSLTANLGAKITFSREGNSSVGDLLFYTRSNTSGPDDSTVERLRITSNGAVGINTTNPIGGTLDVRANPNTGGTIPVASMAGSTSFATLLVDNTQGDLFTASASGQSKFVITQSGSVGIGQSSFSSNAVLQVGRNLTGTANYPIVAIENTSGGTSYKSAFRVLNGGVGWQLGTDLGADTSDDFFIYGGGSGATRLYITSGGKVGIGDTVAVSSANVPSGSVVIGNGAICVDNGGTNCDDAARTAGRIYADNATVVAIDLAENYPSKDNGLQPGDIVTADPDNTEYVRKSQHDYQKDIIGIVSTNPGILLGGFGDEEFRFGSDKKYPIALAGRIPTKVSTINGSIKPGDYLTSSNIPGVAMKATKAGSTVAKAVEAYTNPDPNEIGSIIALINVSTHDPDVYLTDSGNINIFDNGTSPETGNTLFSVKDENDQELSRVGVFSDALAANLRSGGIDTQKLILAGQDVNSRLDQTASQAASLETRIAALETSLQKLLTTNYSLPTLNASSSGELSLDSLEVGSATVSGTLSVLGRTLLNDVGITGRVNIGLLSIDGLNNDGYATINTTVGPLKFQSLGLNGIDILNGKVTIDTEGNITTLNSLTAKTINTTKLNITEDTTSTQSATLSSSAGSVVIEAGETEIDVDTTALTSDSLIFVTPDQPVVVGAKKKDSDTLTIKLQTISTQDIKINWWVVN